MRHCSALSIILPWLPVLAAIYRTAAAASHPDRVGNDLQFKRVSGGPRAAGQTFCDLNRRGSRPRGAVFPEHYATLCDPTKVQIPSPRLFYGDHISAIASNSLTQCQAVCLDGSNPVAPTLTIERLVALLCGELFLVWRQRFAVRPPRSSHRSTSTYWSNDMSNSKSRRHSRDSRLPPKSNGSTVCHAAHTKQLFPLYLKELPIL
jgi:hypothetical protein